MKFEDSTYFDDLKHYKLEMPFGYFYLCDNFLLSELNEGVHFDWDMIKSVMAKVIEHYGENAQIGYISNRVNSYSMDPQTWYLVDRDYKRVLRTGAIVYYNKMMSINASLEKRFTPINIKGCRSLKEAIEWTLSKQDEIKD